MNGGNGQPEPEIIPPGADVEFEERGRDAVPRPSLMDDALTMPRITYGLYAIALVSGIPMLIGLIVAYLARGEAPSWLRGHYTFLIRTFWIGLLLIGVGVVTWIFGIGMFLLWVLPLWYLIRIVRGWVLLENRQSIPDPDSALFG